MADPLEFSRRKVARAEQHIEELNGEILRFHGRAPYQKIVEVDSEDPTYSFHKFRFTEPLPWIMDYIVSDAIHNLRDALDTAVYSVAVASGQINPKNAAFPFGGSETHFNSSGLGRCKDLPDDIQAIFRAYQPYRGGNDMLWALNHLSTTSKHTLLTPLGSIFQSGDMFIEGKTAIKIPIDPIWDRTKNDVIFARFTTGVEPTYNFGFTFLVAFDQIPVVGGEPVLGILDHFCSMVEHILGTLEAESRRLGYFL